MPGAPAVERLDFVLLAAMSAFCSMPIVVSAQRDGHLGVEASFALLLLLALLRTGYREAWSARRTRAGGEVLPGA